MPQLYNMNNPGKGIKLGDFTPIGDGKVHIEYQNKEYIISGKGVVVNGQKVDNYSLQHGDIILVGNTQYFFNDDRGQEEQEKVKEETNIKDRRELPENAEDLIRGLNVAGGSTTVTKTLSTLYTVANAISQVLELEPLLNKILDIIFKVLGADKGSILLNKGGKLVPVAAKEKGKSVPLDQVKVSHSIIDEAIKSKEALLLVNAQTDMRVTGSSIVEQNITSAMCVPLIRKEKLLGVLQVDVTSGYRTFSFEELELLSGIGLQAALAVENALLYQEVRERERIEHEVKLASEIQKQLLPKTVPELTGIEVAGYMIPAKEIGGDYYDFIPGKNENYYFTIGDVSGKGVPAGIIMAMIRSYIHSLVDLNLSVRDILVKTNAFFSDNVERGKFMSLLLLEWSNIDQKLRYSSAGHEHIIYYHAKENTCEAIKAGGTILGLIKGTKVPYQLKEVDMTPGDIIVLYTDGVTEAMNKEHEEYTLERLVKFIGGAKSRKLSSNDLIRKILDETKLHMSGYPQMDDITLLAFRRLESMEPTEGY